MAKQWVTIQEAVRILEISERTVRNKVTKGELEARNAPDGRRQVLIEVPDPAGDMPEFCRSNERQLAVASTAVGLAERHAEIYRSDLRGARWSARVAWVVVAIAVCAIGWGIDAAAILKVHAETARARLADSQADLAETRRQGAQIRARLRVQAAQARAEASEAGGRAQEALGALLRAEREKADLGIALEREKAARAILAARISQAATTQPALAAKAP